MTVRQIHPPSQVGKHATERILGIGVLFGLLLILRNTEFAMAGMRRGITLCMQSVIPALFPFMVLSDLSATYGLGEAIPTFLTAPLRKILRLSHTGATAILLGFFCGFPIGTKYAARAYDNGEIGNAECECVLFLSCVPSSAFLISAVGTSLWHSTRLGILLYMTTIASSLLGGVTLCRARNETTVTAIPSPPPKKRAPFGTVFTDAIRSSAVGILLICAYVLFFSALNETLGRIFSSLDLSRAWNVSLAMLLELSGGMSAAAESHGLFFASLCAFGSAWSGLSVHCQMLALCQRHPFSYRRFLLFKLLQGAIAILLFMLLYPLLKSEF